MKLGCGERASHDRSRARVLFDLVRGQGRVASAWFERELRASASVAAEPGLVFCLTLNVCEESSGRRARPMLCLTQTMGAGGASGSVAAELDPVVAFFFFESEGAFGLTWFGRRGGGRVVLSSRPSLMLRGPV